MFMELLIPTVTEVVEESEDVLDAEAIKNIEDVKTIKKLDAEIEEKSEQLQTHEAESDLFRGKLSENFCPLLELEFNLRIMDIEKKQEILKKRINELRNEKIKIREKIVSGSEDRTLEGIKNLESSFNFGVVSQPSSVSLSDRNHETEFAKNQSERDDIPRRDKDKVFLIKTELRQKLEHSRKAFWKSEDPVYKKHQKEKYFEFLSHLVECSSNAVRPHNLNAMVKVIFQTLELMTGGRNYQEAEEFFVSDDVPDAVEIVRRISVGQAKALICDNSGKRDEKGLKLQEEIEITAMVNSCLVETMKTCKPKKKRPNTNEAVELLLRRETSEVMESMERLADRSDMENYNLARQKIQKLSQLYFVFMGPCDKRDLALTKTFFYDISVISLSVLGSIFGLEIPFNPVLVGNSIDPSKTEFLKQTIFTVSRHLLCSIFRNKRNFDDFLMEMLILFMGEANDSTKTTDTKKPRKETGDDEIIPPKDDSKGDEEFKSKRGKPRNRRGANSSHRGGAQASRGRGRGGPSPRSPGRCHQPSPRGQHQGHGQFV